MIILRKGDKGMLRHLGVLVGPQSTGRVWLLCMKYKSFWGESGDQTGFWMTFFFWGGVSHFKDTESSLQRRWTVDGTSMKSLLIFNINDLMALLDNHQLN